MVSCDLTAKHLKYLNVTGNTCKGRTTTVVAQYSTKSLKLEKVLLLNKMSRLEMERHFQPDLCDEKLKGYCQRHGINYQDLLHHDEVNKRFREKVHALFERFGISVRRKNRLNCKNSDIEWCDAIFPIGGDGTFLQSARWIIERSKPVIGFNSNPSTSEGFLCLPKKYSIDVESAIRKLLDGKFKWMFRTRIRVNLCDKSIDQTPVDFHEVKFDKCDLLSTEREDKTVCYSRPKNIRLKHPILALNEVFMSEVFTGRVSYFEMRLNQTTQNVKIKCSGLCVCTGTGSTSWHASINSLNRQSVRDILKLYAEQTGGKTCGDFETIVANVTEEFNERFKFGGEEHVLGYSIRDLILLGVWPNPKGLIEPRGFAETVEVKSNCKDAGIIVDGGITFSFNEGATVVLETRPEDALRTVVLLDD